MVERVPDGTLDQQVIRELGQVDAHELVVFDLVELADHPQLVQDVGAVEEQVRGVGKCGVAGVVYLEPVYCILHINIAFPDLQTLSQSIRSLMNSQSSLNDSLAYGKLRSFTHNQRHMISYLVAIVQAVV